MSKTVKWQIKFVSDIEKTQYRIDIYADDYSGNPIQLMPGATPFKTEEDNSEDFFAPIRSQSGNIEVCTRMPDGTQLNLDDLLSSTNLSHPVRVLKYVTDHWALVWVGFLSCDMYNQAYTVVPENISLPVISILSAWKSAYINVNKIESVLDLIVELFNLQIGNHFEGLYLPNDYAIIDKLINTSIFVKKEEYQNEENTLYELKGSSAHDILSAICTFMGWTAREYNGELYLEVAQGHGQIDGTTTQDMEDIVFRSNNHQRSIRQGRRIGNVVAKLEKFDIKTGLGEIPYGSFAYEKYQQIGTGGWWVYFLPSSNIRAYSNMVLRFFVGSIKVGIQYDQQYPYEFAHLSTTTDVDEIIENSIPYLAGYPALSTPTSFYTVYAGACFARMQFDEYNNPDNQHQNTQDGLFVSFFPGAYDASNRPTTAIFEMKAVQNFAALEDGYINLSTAFKLFATQPWVGVRQSDNKFAMDIQVGDKVWNGSAWVSATGNNAMFLPAIDIDGEKLEGNWNDQMDIDEVSGYLIPTWYMDGSTKKHVMGPLTIRIYADTYIPNISSALRNTFIGNIFFSEFSVDYIPKRSVRLADRSENNYRRTINTEFAEDVEITTELASWNNNNPSPSLLFNEDGQTPMKYLPYLKADGVTTENRRPEIDLLNRMQEYYSKPRTILKLDVKPIDSIALPLLRLNGLDDGKVYLPLAESRDWKQDTSTLTCFEVGEQEASES